MTKKRTAALAAACVATAAFGATTLPSAAQVAPIASEPLSSRAVFPDRVELKFKVKDHDGEMTVVSTKDASRTAVVKFTVQPGARFPWHTHPGPVVVNIAQGALVYIHSDDCGEHGYAAGEAFVDSGHGHVHSAYNPGTTPTVFYATFFEVPETGPLSIPAEAPDCA
jgi:quercetin dioxygenase-like cupin family protein